MEVIHNAMINEDLRTGSSHLDSYWISSGKFQIKN
jgi:hypothetical protein